MKFPFGVNRKLLGMAGRPVMTFDWNLNCDGSSFSFHPWKSASTSLRVTKPAAMSPDGTILRVAGSARREIVKISADPMNPEPVILLGAFLHEAPPDVSGAELVQVNANTAKKIMGIDVLPSKSEAWAKSYPQ